jgi:DNA-binding response OmpR family regulator
MEKKNIILVVDDEPSIRMGLAATIRRYGYEVITAVNGDDGFLKARQSLPDLIVSDVMMPDLNGFEMKQQMSDDPVLASIPFIFLTARTATQDRVAGMREGADDYVTKPFITEELMARIEAVLRRVQTEQKRGREQVKQAAQDEMDKLRREVLQNFSHELRTPLGNVMM